MAVPRIVWAQLDTLYARRKKPSAVAPAIRPTTANWMFRTMDSTPRLAASGIPKRRSLLAIVRSNPTRNGTRAHVITRIPITRLPDTCPHAKLYAPAPRAASVMDQSQ